MVRFSVQHSCSYTKDFLSWYLAAKDRLIQPEVATIIGHIEGGMSSKITGHSRPSICFDNAEVLVLVTRLRESGGREVNQAVIYRGFPLSISNKFGF